LLGCEKIFSVAIPAWETLVTVLIGVSDVVVGGGIVGVAGGQLDGVPSNYRGNNMAEITSWFISYHIKISHVTIIAK